MRRKGFVIFLAALNGVLLACLLGRRLRPSAPLFNPALVRLQRQVGEVNFDQIPFEQVLERVRAGSGCRLDVRWDVLSLEGIERDTPVSLHLHDVKWATVLRLAMQDVQYSLTPDGNLWLHRGEHPAVRLYRVDHTIEPLTARTLEGRRKAVQSSTKNFCFGATTTIAAAPTEESVERELSKDLAGVLADAAEASTDSARHFGGRAVIFERPQSQERAREAFGIVSAAIERQLSRERDARGTAPPR